jgi:hypothetical protein
MISEIKQAQHFGKKWPLAWLFLPAVVSLLAISGQSFWIDEANSAVKAVQPSAEAFINSMKGERGSDLQMPLYMLSLWGWEKLVGSSEYALRAMNIPMFLAAVGAVLAFLSGPRPVRYFFCLFAICSPMVWAYLDEARPYMLQFMSTTFIMVGLMNLANERKHPSLGNAVLVAAGILLLCASSLMGVIYSFFFGLAFLWCWLRIEPISTTIRRLGIWALALGSAVGLAVLAAYYLWTLSVGARASGIGRTNPMSMGFCAYELLGFSGLGPGRAELRDDPMRALRQFIPLLALHAGILGLFLLASIKFLTAAASRSRLRAFIPIIASVVATAVAVTLLGLVAEFRIIGRHFMPILPFLLLGFATLAWGLWNQCLLLRRGVVAALLLVSLFSCLSLRAMPRFAKDDYRSAASVAKDAVHAKKAVWWAADPAAANFYGVFPVHAGEAGSVFFANSRDVDYLSRLPAPDVVLFSKTDIYDKHGSLAAYLSEHGYKVSRTFPAFTVWGK